jgi:hypothetical protein
MVGRGFLPRRDLVGEPNAPIGADVGAWRKLAVTLHSEKRLPRHRDDGEHLSNSQHAARLCGVDNLIAHCVVTSLPRVRELYLEV